MFFLMNSVLHESRIVKSNCILFFTRLILLQDENNKNYFKVLKRFKVFLTVTFFFLPVFDNSGEKPNQEKVWSF